MSNHKLQKQIVIKGEITLLSGLLIGGSNTELAIGKLDKLVVRNPIKSLPYIPGSSLKGKLRSLYEQANGTIGDNGGPSNDPQTKSAKLFGYVAMNSGKSQRASRIIVRDCQLINPQDLSKTELLYTEVKAENTIDRITSKANPRFFERVPMGAKFNMEFVINVFDGDSEEEFLNTIHTCLKLLKNDYLGMGGSRGNGQVNIEITSEQSFTISDYELDTKESDQNLK
jgi:CRISPR-associated protein Csm3